MVAAFPFTPIELLCRAIKDLIADTGPQGALRHIIRERKSASLAFYVAFLDGMRKVFFPEIGEAFQHFMAEGRWDDVERAVSDGYRTAARHAQALVGIFRQGKERNNMAWVEGEIERRILGPLGLGRPKD